MMGLGFWEVLIVLFVGAFLFAAPIAVIVLIVRLPQSSGNNRLAQLEEENRRQRKLLTDNGIPHGGIPPKK